MDKNFTENNVDFDAGINKLLTEKNFDKEKIADSIVLIKRYVKLVEDKWLIDGLKIDSVIGSLITSLDLSLKSSSETIDKNISKIKILNQSLDVKKQAIIKSVFDTKKLTLDFNHENEFNLPGAISRFDTAQVNLKNIKLQSLTYKNDTDALNEKITNTKGVIKISFDKFLKDNNLSDFDSNIQKMLDERLNQKTGIETSLSLIKNFTTKVEQNWVVDGVPIAVFLDSQIMSLKINLSSETEKLKQDLMEIESLKQSLADTLKSKHQYSIEIVNLNLEYKQENDVNLPPAILLFKKARAELINIESKTETYKNDTDVLNEKVTIVKKKFQTDFNFEYSNITSFTGISDMKNEIHRIEEAYNSITSEISNLQTTINEWQKKYDDKKNILQTASSLSINLNNQISEVETNIQSTDTEALALKSDLSDLVLKRANIFKMNKELSSELGLVSDILKVLTDQNITLKKNLKNSRVEETFLQKQINFIKSINNTTESSSLGLLKGILPQEFQSTLDLKIKNSQWLEEITIQKNLMDYNSIQLESLLQTEIELLNSIRITKATKGKANDERTKEIVLIRNEIQDLDTEFKKLQEVKEETIYKSKHAVYQLDIIKTENLELDANISASERAIILSSSSNKDLQNDLSVSQQKVKVLDDLKAKLSVDVNSLNTTFNLDTDRNAELETKKITLNKEILSLNFTLYENQILVSNLKGKKTNTELDISNIKTRIESLKLAVDESNKNFNHYESVVSALISIEKDNSFNINANKLLIVDLESKNLALLELLNESKEENKNVQLQIIQLKADTMNLAISKNEQYKQIKSNIETQEKLENQIAVNKENSKGLEQKIENLMLNNLNLKELINTKNLTIKIGTADTDKITKDLEQKNVEIGTLNYKLVELGIQTKNANDTKKKIDSDFEKFKVELKDYKLRNENITGFLEDAKSNLKQKEIDYANLVEHSKIGNKKFKIDISFLRKRIKKSTVKSALEIRKKNNLNTIQLNKIILLKRDKRTLNGKLDMCYSDVITCQNNLELQQKTTKEFNKLMDTSNTYQKKIGVLFMKSVESNLKLTNFIKSHNYPPDTDFLNISNDLSPNYNVNDFLTTNKIQDLNITLAKSFFNNIYNTLVKRWEKTSPLDPSSAKGGSSSLADTRSLSPLAEEADARSLSLVDPRNQGPRPLANPREGPREEDSEVLKVKRDRVYKIIDPDKKKRIQVYNVYSNKIKKIALNFDDFNKLWDSGNIETNENDKMDIEYSIL
jgi:chromosome segregation ATPase